MNTPLVSIIVPIYNAEKYIHECIDSLLAQTYTNIEVILVDDGSIDNCGKICDDYASKDKRVKVIHQKNGGVSVARQTGILHATGEYSIHADPDDWVEPNMIEKLVTKAKEDDADMVICDFYRESNSGKHYVRQDPGIDLSVINIVRKILNGQLHGSCWNKLLKRSSIIGIDFVPDDLCILEDALYNIRILARHIKLSYLSEAFYHYYISNDNSLCNTVSEKIFESKVKAAESIELFCFKNFPELSAIDFISLKSCVLYDALRMKKYDHLVNLPADFKNIFIMSGVPYNIYEPNLSCLALALKGYPKSASIICYLNWKLLAFLQKVKEVIRYIISILCTHL